ncbi:HNH endonuclease signature motif containing protein [Pseudarthrobacter sp. W1I19]|uniref:HNH endonuclease n=1 Tax=Pseudarthrobacter sp. W1I19 TaxID=3042288 RepID=UPI0027D79DDE|nr:HNH endonuclease signature motif containing protein [Pseudarthrobacter sp. W1I19]
MEVGPFVIDDEAWVPVVEFTDGEDSLLAGTVSFPVPAFLTADGAIRMVQSADRLIAWATGMKHGGLARVEEAVAEESRGRQENQPVRFGGDEAHALAVTEVSTACALSEGTAARLLNDASELTGPLWEVLEALEAGDISDAHARIIVDQARSLPDGQAERFASVALRRTRTRHGRRRTPAELRACLRRLREQLHPESLAARKEAARRERGVWFRAEPDGMCTLTAFLTAEVGMAIYSGLDRDARLASARAAELKDLRDLPGPGSASGHSAAAEPGTAPGSGTAPGAGTAPGSGTARGAGAGADSPTLSEFRAESLAYRLLGGPESGASDKLFGGPDGAESGVFRPEIVVTIPVGQVMGGSPGSGGDAVAAEPATLPSAAAGLGAAGLPGAESGAAGVGAAGPAAGDFGTAELEGYGPLDAATARCLAALAPAWYLLFTDGTTGQALGAGRRAYRPPKALRRYLQCRDGTCRFPGCTHRASACEPDHTIEWQDGGTTDPGNLAMLCRRHHALKSIGAWSYRHSSPSGDLEWRSPLGRHYTTEAADHGKVLYPLQQPEPPPF